MLPIAMFLLQRDSQFLTGHDLFLKRIGAAYHAFLESAERQARRAARCSFTVLGLGLTCDHAHSAPRVCKEQRQEPTYWAARAVPCLGVRARASGLRERLSAPASGSPARQPAARREGAAAAVPLTLPYPLGRVQCRGKCQEDLMSTTRYVTWSLHTKSRASLKAMLSRARVAAARATLRPIMLRTRVLCRDLFCSHLRPVSTGRESALAEACLLPARPKPCPQLWLDNRACLGHTCRPTGHAVSWEIVCMSVTAALLELVGSALTRRAPGTRWRRRRRPR